MAAARPSSSGRIGGSFLPRSSSRQATTSATTQTDAAAASITVIVTCIGFMRAASSRRQGLQAIEQSDQQQDDHDRREQRNPLLRRDPADHRVAVVPAGPSSQPAGPLRTLLQILAVLGVVRRVLIVLVFGPMCAGIGRTDRSRPAVCLGELIELGQQRRHGRLGQREMHGGDVVGQPQRGRARFGPLDPGQVRRERLGDRLFRLRYVGRLFFRYVLPFRYGWWLRCVSAPLVGADQARGVARLVGHRFFPPLAPWVGLGALSTPVACAAAGSLAAITLLLPGTAVPGGNRTLTLAGTGTR